MRVWGCRLGPPRETPDPVLGPPWMNAGALWTEVPVQPWVMLALPQVPLWEHPGLQLALPTVLGPCGMGDTGLYNQNQAWAAGKHGDPRVRGLAGRDQARTNRPVQQPPPQLWHRQSGPWEWRCWSNPALSGEGWRAQGTHPQLPRAAVTTPPVPGPRLPIGSTADVCSVTLTVTLLVGR